MPDVDEPVTEPFEITEPSETGEPPETGDTVAPQPPVRLKKVLRRLAKVAMASALIVGVAVAGSVTWVRYEARGHVYPEADVPAAPVALVLGAQVHDDGTLSRFLQARLDIAKRLYDRGKVRAILVSGDNGRPDYDEPDAMKQYLIQQGIPARKVVADYAGFDTYDSCDRAKRIFGVTKVIVVTQSYHIARAVTLCRERGLDAVGVGDRTVAKFRYHWTLATIREQGACVKAVYDVASGRDPALLGKHETGMDDALRDE
jgi:vancomycin permeability regulator SanA